MTTEAVRSWRDLCDNQPTRGPTPRIDTLRNRLAATRSLLAMVEDELGDLNVLAYDRARVARERVDGGERDWALDTHGDPRARDAYREIGLAAVHALEVLADSHHAALKLLRSGTLNGRSPRYMVNSEELAQVLEAQARRVARDEYTPTARETQPNQAHAEEAVARLIRERDRYKALAERFEKRLTRYEPPPNGRKKAG